MSISSDEAFANAVNQMGAATLEHIETAKAAQGEAAMRGKLLTLADIMVQHGLITPAMRESIEKKLQAQQEGGLRKLGHYKLLKKLGEGGMGAVFLAEDTNMMRKIALKVLPKKHAGDVEFLTRFRREAKATGKLNHVNIIAAFDAGEDMGHHYYAMEYCEGEPLDAVLKREKVLSADKALAIVVQVARGLQHAHQHGFIHRDIKPANIFVTTAGGVAKILDLGLSKNIGDISQSFNTQTGMAMGTPHYISPEQAKGDKGIDGRTDIYSLGATFYHLITGETPFQGSTAALIMLKHLNEQLPNPQDINENIPDGVAHVIARMMAKEPGDRYADCGELLDDLEMVNDGKAPSSHTIDEGKSSVAMRKAVRGAAAELNHMGAPGRLRRSTGPQQPAGARRGAATTRSSGPRRDAEEREAKQDSGKPKTALYIGGSVAVLGLAVLIFAMTRSGEKPEAAQSGAVISAHDAEEKRKTEYDAKVSTATHDATIKQRDDAIEAIPSPPPLLAIDLGGGVKLEMALVKAGEFTMGDDSGKVDEKPAHKVKLSQPYYIAKYETTVAQFRRFAETAKYETECERIGNKGRSVKDGKWQESTGINWKNPGFEQTPDHPVVLVTWNDAQAFAVWLSKLTGRDIRLPKEAQWEYAARGTENKKYPWGDNWDGALANHADITLKNTGFASWGYTTDNDGFAYTSPVGNYKNSASWCGAFDMAGNQWEWIEDRFSDKYYADSPAVDPKGPTDGSDRVLRGGAWNSGPDSCRSALRHHDAPGLRAANCGFRVVAVSASWSTP